ncbi:helix-turn-helix domain-containing protein [Chitinophaga sp. SYP-B3965]|uniref:helix-turn-helix domain-containing protein n=1 Tax=Chitinophaga sp. SYP-B3965 TaxID=2663120 RepID=UPI001299ACF7|nr:AraC family transcriptional regulator [Chitinophaga sp. SYP-B3965]MRG43826.1 helix-turn-helix domain-containing protein [Chitinophaga sp. SYP-B3965]
MIFKRILPPPGLARIIECYWIAESEDARPAKEKIIPDGFPEMIFHYGDPYRINLHHATWELQSQSLLAGQIRQYFFLENTGKSGVLGIKLQPTALTYLFDISMHTLTDKVVDLSVIMAVPLQSLLCSPAPHDEKITAINEWMGSFPLPPQDHAEKAIDLIREHKGAIAVAEIITQLGISERHLERLFKKYVGLSPKFYARIIRFNHIFHLNQERNPTWTDLAFNAGYYDQSHFIRNFKAFTGEDPSGYYFEEDNMANFFLQKRHKKTEMTTGKPGDDTWMAHG